jgi:hypothetical protein
MDEDNEIGDTEEILVEESTEVTIVIIVVPGMSEGLIEEDGLGKNTDGRLLAAVP